MSENLKFVVNEVNHILKTDFNLMSFESIPLVHLLQIVIDILHFYNVVEKIDVKVVDREVCQRQFLEALKKIQYKVSNETEPSFYQSLMNFEKQTLYLILQYIFENKEKINNIVYLAHFLIPIKISDEAVSHTEIAYIWKEYMQKINTFKVTHKGYIESSAEKTYIKDLRNDIHTIETEKNHVLERIAKIQFRLDKVLHKDILEKSQVLRLEKNREKQINTYIKEHNVERHRTKMIQNQLKKELSNNLTTQNDLTPEFIMQNIEEEAEVMKFLVKQKLPKEQQMWKNKYNKLENISRMNITREYINTLRNKVEQKSIQLQNLVEKLPSENLNYNDTQKLTVFKQQVTAVIEKKETAAELLNSLSKELSHIKNILLKKQNQIESIFGDVILRGEELKQYVDKLKSKNLTYKQNRTELSSIKAEVIDLMKMLEGLKSQEPNISITLKQNNNAEVVPGSQISINGKGLTEILRITEALKRAVSSNRDHLAPLTQKVKPLRERIEELKDESDSKKQFFNSVDMTLRTETSVFQSKIREKEDIINALENEYKKLQLEYERAEFLLKKIKDTRASNFNSKTELKEDMQKQIYEKENLFKYLEQQAQILSNNQSHYKKQQELWSAVRNTLKIKLNCLKETEENEKSGTLSIQKNIETFILN